MADLNCFCPLTFASLAHWTASAYMKVSYSSFSFISPLAAQRLRFVVFQQTNWQLCGAAEEVLIAYKFDS